eukprot:scaffold56465_cov35-Tisochrysis_lutea.AAC.2
MWADLQLVLVLRDRRDALLETLTLADLRDELNGILVGVRVAIHRVPMVEHELREGLPTSVLAKERGEAERLRDGQVSLHSPQRRARAVDLLDDGAALAGSWRRGDAVIIEARKQRRAVGMIWPPPRWIASACRTTS